jgi:hypothetical protein
MKVVQRFKSLANSYDFTINLYNHKDVIVTLQSKDVSYCTVESTKNTYYVIVKDGTESVKISSNISYSKVLGYIKAFEGCLQYAVYTDKKAIGIDISNLKYLCEQYPDVVLTEKDSEYRLISVTDLLKYRKERV